MSDRLDTLLDLAPAGFSLWRTAEGGWQLNLKAGGMAFAVLHGASVDQALAEAKTGMMFRRADPCAPAPKKPETAPRRRVL